MTLRASAGPQRGPVAGPVVMLPRGNASGNLFVKKIGGAPSSGRKNQRHRGGSDVRGMAVLARVLLDPLPRPWLMGTPAGGGRHPLHHPISAQAARDSR
jgi:hypothetical protein